MPPRGAAAVWAAIAAVLALFLGLTMALAFANPGAQPGATVAAADVAEAQVDLGEFAISPAEVTVPAGVPLRLDVRNGGALEHDLVVDSVAETAMIPAGGTETLDLPPLEPGRYRMWCSVAGHEGAGMEATLVVGEGDGAHAGHAKGDMTPEEMAEAHEQLVADFPVETEGAGGLPLEPTVGADGVKVFELTAGEISWETEPGTVVEAMAYNGMVPGPQIDVDLGDEVRIVLHNELSVPTAIHFHGLVVPVEMDGVPGLTQPSVMPGESFTYEFEVRNAGSHMYHSHFDAAHQVPSGLLGAFIVHDPDDAWAEDVDLDYVMVLNDGPLGYTLNGKGFPATEPVVAELGQRLRVRYMNEGLQIHPMHLHGIPQLVVARDGYPLPQPYMVDTVNIAPGERIDVIVDATEPGPWAWHCHILTHAEREDGMFGMVTALVVND